MKKSKLISAVTAFVCGLTCLVPVHTMAYETGDSEVYEESASTETTVVQTDLYDAGEPVTTAPKQTAVTTTTTITSYEIVTLPVTTAYIAGVDINNVRPANAENVVIEPGSTAEMKLSISDNMDIFDNCSGRMNLPEGINCEKISYGDGGIAEINVSGSAVTFEMPESTVTITLSADEDISDGEYQISFDYITRTYSRPSGDIYIAGGYRYKVSGGAVTVKSPAVTTSVTTTSETTQTTVGIVTSVSLTSISIDDLYPPYTRSTDIVRNAYADDVVLRNGESAEMKLSVPDREESDGSCSVTVNLPFGVYCNSVINSEDGEYIPFHMETSSEETVVSFSNSSDEVVITLSVGGEISTGTYQAIFNANGLYTIDVTSGETYAYLYGNYEYVFSGGAIEITDSETSDETQVRGDISGNGEIDLYDAIEIAKEILGMRTFTEAEKQIADINGDGMVNLYDAIEIARMII